jgi:succinyl-CoA synthetase beta subunit
LNIHEYQAKELLGEKGVPLQRGEVASTPEQAGKIAETFDRTVVIKAQVHSGSRGKAGGVKLCRDACEAESTASRILGMTIGGLVVKKVLVAEAVDIVREFYLGIALDRSRNKHVLIYSTMGGKDIEDVARSNPEAVIREEIDPLLGLGEFQIRSIIDRSNLSPEQQKQMRHIIRSLYESYFENECTLAEINPIVTLPDGSLIAVDAKMVIDDNALYRLDKLLRYREFTELDPIEYEAKKQGINFVRLSGDIGIMGNGAGLVMYTIDMLEKSGGKAANFLDIGGGAKADVVQRSLELILMNNNVRGILVNIFGGITRCDEVATGIIKAFEKMDIQVPVVIRLKGTCEEPGRQLLVDAGFHTEESLEDAAVKILTLTR